MRSERLRIADFSGRPLTLADGPEAWETLKDQGEDLLLLGLAHGTELTTATHVNQQHHCQLTLLLENLDMRFVLSGRDVPVDVAHVIAILVLAHLGERHTMTSEGSLVTTCKDIGAQASGLDFNLPDLFYQLSGFHKSKLKYSKDVTEMCKGSDKDITIS